MRRDLTVAGVAWLAACSFDSTAGSGSPSEIGDTTEAVDDTEGDAASTSDDGTDHAPADATGSGDDATSDATADGTSSADTGCERWTWYPDADGDDFGDPGAPVSGCNPPPGHTDNGDDCNDGDPAVNPGATEQCDGRDTDCDGAVDEWSTTNAQCGGCTTVVSGPWVYYVCQDVLSFDAARGACQLKGADLASIESADENAIVNSAVAVLALGDAWIGLRRVAGTFGWVDGTPLGYTNWRTAKPDGSGPCGELSPADQGQWNDVPCDKTGTTGGFVCKAAP